MTERSDYKDRAIGPRRPGVVYESGYRESVVLAVNRDGEWWEWTVTVYNEDGEIREHRDEWESQDKIIDRALTPQESAMVAVFKAAGERHMTDAAAHQLHQQVLRAMAVEQALRGEFAPTERPGIEAEKARSFHEALVEMNAESDRRMSGPRPEHMKYDSYDYNHVTSVDDEADRSHGFDR